MTCSFIIFIILAISINCEALLCFRLIEEESMKGDKLAMDILIGRSSINQENLPRVWTKEINQVSHAVALTAQRLMCSVEDPILVGSVSILN